MTATETRDEVALAVSREFTRAANGLPALFDLTATEIATLGDLTVAYGAAPDPNDPEAVEQMQAAVERLEMLFAENDALVVRKIENYLHVMETQTSMVDGFKKRAKRLRDHAAAIERGQDALKARLIQAMHAMGRESVVTPSGVVSIRQNPVSCVVLEEQLVPAEFKKTVVTTTVDLMAIKAWVKTTGEIPSGVELVRKESLRIA